MSSTLFLLTGIAPLLIEEGETMTDDEERDNERKGGSAGSENPCPSGSVNPNAGGSADSTTLGLGQGGS
jgi:hypothetical protein